MEIFPSIDLRGGKVVRLSQGDYDRQTTYGDDPVAVAETFIAAGAKWIHMVDLDAALTGERTNADAIAAVCEQTDALVELGGGIRDDQAVADAIDLGVARVIVGSAALKDWQWFSKLARRGDLDGKVVLGMDAHGGILRTHGLPIIASGGMSNLDDISRCKSIGCAGAIIGRAYYEGKIDLAEAFRIARA